MESNSTEADGRDSFENEAGRIDNLNVQGWVSVIHCKAGSRRSSHYHKTDEHTLHVVSGRMWYTERPVGHEGGGVRWMNCPAGSKVHTGPMMEHWTEFPVDTVLVSVSRLHRTHEQHERDVVRIGWFE